jgi:hypothetical protein
MCADSGRRPYRPGVAPGVEPAIAALARTLSVARVAGAIAVRGAAVAAGSAAVLTWALFGDGLPDETAETVARLVVAAALLAPAVVLVLFWRACLDVLELPGRLRALPGTAAGHAAELNRLVRDRQLGRGRRAWRGIVLARSIAELLGIHAPLVALLSPLFLAAALAALAATALEALAALVVLLSRV